MSSIKRICIVTNAYPFNGNALQPFVEQLVNTFIDMGVLCDVVVPRSLTNSLIRKSPLPPKVYRAVTYKNNEYNVYFPRYFTISASDGRLGRICERFNAAMFSRAAKKAVKRHQINCDLFYGHFFNPGGLAAAELSSIYNKPYFVACGENYLTSLNKMGSYWVKKKLEKITGVVAVSTNNKNELMKCEYVNKEKVEVFVNAIDSNIFNQRNKSEMRRKYNVKEDAFVVCFVGRFVDVKGPKRLSNALSQIESVHSVFLGTGSEYPDCDNILFCGAVSHEQVPEYLSLSDLFVLPTLAEGCCNAIIEAMACGLPIVSSDLPFNDDILDDEYSIRVDPTNIEEIRSAIIYLMENNNIRIKMAAAAAAKATEFNLGKRAENILEFMESKIKNE